MRRLRNLAVLLVAAPLAVVGAASATALATGCDTGPNDFDGNGGTDLAIGAPYADDNLGRVYVEMKTASGTRQVVIDAPKGSAPFSQFGSAVGEVDLSDHTDASQPCSDLVVGNYHGTVFIYRWDSAANNFVLLSKIFQKSIGPNIYGFGLGFATELVPYDRPAPREHVLSVGALTTTPTSGGGVPRGAVVRLTLTTKGTVASDEVIQPGERATASVPMVRAGARLFGGSIAGTTDPDEVVVGAPDSGVNGQSRAGAVLDWRRAGTSELITQDTPGVPGVAEAYDYFGSTVWLDHEAAADTRTPTSAFVGSPGENIGTVSDAGAVWQFGYRPAHAKHLDLTTTQTWSQRSPGVYGAVTAGHRFGYAVQATSIAGGIPEHAALTHPDDPVLIGLGTGTHYSLPKRRAQTLGAWHDVDDNLPDDPYPATSASQWLAGVVVGFPRKDEVIAGPSSSTVFDPGSCKPSDGSYCGFGTALGDSGA